MVYSVRDLHKAIINMFMNTAMEQNNMYTLIARINIRLSLAFQLSNERDDAGTEF